MASDANGILAGKRQSILPLALVQRVPYSLSRRPSVALSASSEQGLRFVSNDWHIAFRPLGFKLASGLRTVSTNMQSGHRSGLDKAMRELGLP
jgi:hypothetical protein